ncbi:MAG TPA: beta-galactosidase trimerization domain-containing protein [Candidatus Brocadiia bacterium]|nr:beta-galactosidase trimerization domain-containing protein [Candidatus Brocadiia bacterium]
MNRLRYRQIHLDFHTSEDVPGIGSEFDADEFADTLKAAHVNSITCFSRCHHGWIYHDTEKFPERRHPNLECNLLKEQIEACHARDIRVPIYITVQWDLFTSRRHPEWLVMDENGGHPGTKPFDAGFYRRFCLNSDYVNFIEEQTTEVCETLEVDGIFFDIVDSTPCCCWKCVQGMITDGLEPSNAAHRAQYADAVLRRFQDRLFKVVRSRRPDATVFFNAGHVGPRHRGMIGAFSHLELESLPSGGWGYMHFPVAQRYGRNLGVATLGMTGKFHTSWGDFHSFKNPAALEFECLNMLALGARCSIGDQLHPSGKICKHTYDLIGGAYAKVEAAEPWCHGAEPVVEIGLMTPEEFAAPRLHPAAIGATRMLQELQHQFDIIDSKSDLGKYKVVVLPDEIPVSGELARKLSRYVAGGGAILASYKSGLKPDGSGFAMPELGVEYKGEAEFSPDFIVPGKLDAGLADTEYVMYLRGLSVEALPGAEVLCGMIKPYFNRTYRHFCSHRHAPAGGVAEYPGAVKNGNCVYFMHPIFTQYDKCAPLWCKKLVRNAISLLLPEQLVKAEAPSSTILALNRQPEWRKLVLHVLSYVPERRGRDFDVIEDVVPIFNVKVRLRADGDVTGVSLVPQGAAIDFERIPGGISFTIPKVEGHQMVSVQLG